MAQLDSGSPNHAGRWLLLIHQMPPKPDYFRVKIWRRLQNLGSVAIKNSVYALPNTEQGHEDFQWTVREILAGGGEAMVCNAELVDGLSDEQVVKMFQKARDADYKVILQQVKTLAVDPRSRDKNARPVAERRAETFKQLQRLKRRLAEISAIDFFDSASRDEAEKRIAAVEEKLQAHSRPISQRTETKQRSQDYRGKTWITRKGIHVDRIASAWLIRRFIDPAARFGFVSPEDYRPKGGHVRFDMFDAEFTHEGNHCTFEVLCERFALTNPTLLAIGEIIHDIDLKELKFNRQETPGIRRLIAGIALNHAEDSERLKRGFALLDDLYASFRNPEGQHASRKVAKSRGTARIVKQV